MPVTLALAGDTMLGRAVAERTVRRGPGGLFAPGLVEVAAEADAVLLNLECCISARGEPTTAVPGKPFFFRAPPRAVEALNDLGVTAVTLANNHALDYGPQALLDTLALLEAAGIRAVGAGPGQAEARAPEVLTVGGLRIGLLGLCDHPEEYAAGPDTPGVAYADLWSGVVPEWVVASVRELRRRTDAVLVEVHWGPNMEALPRTHVRQAAPVLLQAGATLVVGHSAHVFQGMAPQVLFDLGDFIDDYAVDPELRNDLGLLFLVELDEHGPGRIEAVPIALEYCHTRLARPAEYRWIRERLARACAEFGTKVTDGGRRLAVRTSSDAPCPRNAG
ncbi:CapA family protein [Streptomyces sp. NBC_01280]|uniref:CapA family protein n=1 Tax=unclassified Streptomyces TaxID=2593676 RepID=UPI002E372EA9|nr:CapA family protein [Streptomyces sp. NBC_01280]WSE12225.1 CapA family protein [Streptomyces sp. NBC_01397]WSE19404.1 CapA family protein [Streptomyces sp. NBC_01397]